MFRKGLIAAAVSVAMLTGAASFANAAELGQQCGGISGIGCDSGLWCEGDVGDRRRHREHDVIIRHRQQVGLAFGEPLLGRCTLVGAITRA
jgi:hypothetical protein